MKKAALLFILCTSIVFAAVYFYLKPPPLKPSVRELIYHEVKQLSHFLQDYNRADLLYRMGEDESSLQEAASILKETAKKLEQLSKSENNTNTHTIIENSPLNYYYLEFIDAYKILINNYNLTIEVNSEHQQRATPSDIIANYNTLLAKTDIYIQALVQQGETNNINEKDIISFAKEILLSTYKTDSVAYRTEIYERLAELMHVATSSGKPIMIGVKVDYKMNLYFIMRKPDDLLYDILFSDLVQSLPLYGVLPLRDGEIPLAGRYVHRLTQKYIHGKKLTFLQANPNAPIDPKKLIILLEDGTSIQEHLLNMGATRIDTSIPNIPVKWEVIENNAKDLKLGIYQ